MNKVILLTISYDVVAIGIVEENFIAASKGRAITFAETYKKEFETKDNFRYILEEKKVIY